jgi:hypothetical protein
MSSVVVAPANRCMTAARANGSGRSGRSVGPRCGLPGGSYGRPAAERSQYLGSNLPGVCGRRFRRSRTRARAGRWGRKRRGEDVTTPALPSHQLSRARRPQRAAVAAPKLTTARGSRRCAGRSWWPHSSSRLLPLWALLRRALGAHARTASAAPLPPPPNPLSANPPLRHRAAPCWAPR